MKNLFVALVALLFAFFLGCQSTITEPVEMEHTKFLNAGDENVLANKDHKSMFPDVANLEATIIDEKTAGNTAYDLVGSVRYKVESTDALEATKYSIVKVELFVNADITSSDPGQGPWVLTSTDVELVSPPANVNAFKILEKQYKVVNVQGTYIEVTVNYTISGSSISTQVVNIKKIENIDPYTKVF
jgi:hypothetical protein